MKPTLLAFELAGKHLQLPTYGVLVMLGFVAGIALVVRDGRQRGLPADALLDLSWWILVAGITGSRLLYVVLSPGELAAHVGVGDWLWPLRIWDGGLVFYGGGIAATGVTAWYAHRRGWRFLDVADLYAPGVALGHVIGRIGCFAAGCCYGKACPPGGALCVHFPPESVAHQQLIASGVSAPPPLYPAQLLEAGAILLLFVALRLHHRRQQRRTAPAQPGQTFLLYLTGYALLRFLLELYRGDFDRRFLWELSLPSLARALGLPATEPLFLSTSQAVSLALLAAGVVGLIGLFRRGRAAGGHNLAGRG
jgi:phosphatidylglycerol:prolipoprotein diacylglycerol transferase